MEIETITLEEALSLELQEKIIIYNSGKVISKLNELPENHLWGKNWGTLLKKWDFDLRIEYKYLENDVIYWVYMYAKYR